MQMAQGEIHHYFPFNLTADARVNGHFGRKNERFIILKLNILNF